MNNTNEKIWENFPKNYRKRPIYTKCDDGFTYFDFNT